MKLRIKYKLAKAKNELLKIQTQQAHRLQEQLYNSVLGTMDEIAEAQLETAADRDAMQRVVVKKFIETNETILASIKY